MEGGPFRQRHLFCTCLYPEVRYRCWEAGGPLEKAEAGTRGSIFKAIFVLRSIFLISYQAFFYWLSHRHFKFNMPAKKVTLFSQYIHPFFTPCQWCIHPLNWSWKKKKDSSSVCNFLIQFDATYYHRDRKRKQLKFAIWISLSKRNGKEDNFVAEYLVQMLPWCYMYIIFDYSFLLLFLI